MAETAAGGSIILRVNPGLNTLDKVHRQPFYRAASGEKGGKNNRTGANGGDIILEVPPGTVVKNFDTGEIILDMEETDGEAVIARGGDGGKGNARFATPTNQAPRHATPGFPGEEFTALFELKLVAQVGLAGLPNAGKSTLISRITGARPRIADYPFTTLQPILGTITLENGSALVVADIPGIIQGAHEGVGLGLDFLRHIERTRILVYVVEISPHDPNLPARTLNDLQYEIGEYDPAILERPFLVALNKLDLLDDPEELELVLNPFMNCVRKWKKSKFTRSPLWNSREQRNSGIKSLNFTPASYKATPRMKKKELQSRCVLFSPQKYEYSSSAYTYEPNIH